MAISDQQDESKGSEGGGGGGCDLNNLEYMLLHSCWSGLAISVMMFLRTATLLTMYYRNFLESVV